MRVRQRAQQYAFHHREDGSIRSNPEREGENGQHSHPGIFSQLPKRSPQILKQGMQGDLRGGNFQTWAGTFVTKDARVPYRYS